MGDCSLEARPVIFDEHLRSDGQTPQGNRKSTRLERMPSRCCRVLCTSRSGGPAHPASQHIPQRASLTPRVYAHTPVALPPFPHLCTNRIYAHSRSVHIPQWRWARWRACRRGRRTCTASTGRRSTGGGTTPPASAARCWACRRRGCCTSTPRPAMVHAPVARSRLQQRGASAGL